MLYIPKDAFAQPELTPIECVVFVDISAPAGPDRGIVLIEIQIFPSGVAVCPDNPNLRFRLKLSNERLEDARLLLASRKRVRPVPFTGPAIYNQDPHRLVTLDTTAG